MQPKISIIMPAYNVEKYIATAINSIISQTIGINYLELIIVNDGSTDKTLEIVNQYSNKYSQITIMNINKRIGLPGKLRNIAMLIASGEYIMFLDSDDIMVNDACEKLYTVIKKYDSDFLFGTYAFLYDENERVEPSALFNQKKYKEPIINSNMAELYDKFKAKADTFTIEEVIKHPGTSCTKIYNSDFLKNNCIFFPPDVVTGEDYVFNHKCFLNSTKISFIPFQVFYYRRRDDINNKSITQTFTTSIINEIIKQKIETAALYKNTPYPYEELSNYYFLSLLYYKIIERRYGKTEELIRIFQAIGPNLHLFNLEDPTLALHARVLFKYIYVGKYDEAIKHIRK